MDAPENAVMAHHDGVFLFTSNDLRSPSFSQLLSRRACRSSASFANRYPKYIAGIREVVIKGVDRHDKRPDFLLVDANGYIDILEIKKPSVQLLTRQSSYRNNYVPVRELAGAIQQIEKYIYCLNAWGNTGEDTLKKQLSSFLPDSVLPKIVNPQGILLLGRSNQFSRQQRDDFELIKRQYKHIAEIMTYDDLVQRIDNIIAALSLHLK